MRTSDLHSRQKRRIAGSVNPATDPGTPMRAYAEEDGGAKDVPAVRAIKIWKIFRSGYQSPMLCGHMCP